MTKESIKISQEINFNGMPTWVSIGATLLPEDNVIESLKSLQKDITEYHQTEEGLFSKSKFSKAEDIKPTKTLMEEMAECTTYADIQSFRFTVKNKEEQQVYENKLQSLQTKN